MNTTSKMSKQELDSLKEALEYSLEMVARWKREDEEEEERLARLEANEVYDSATRGSFDASGMVKS